MGRIGQERKPFRSRWGNLVAGWCFEYFRKYGKSPRGAIHQLLARHAASNQDGELQSSVESFLDGLGHDYRALRKSMNEQFLVDMASGYFRKVRLERLTRDVESALERSDPDTAEESVRGYESIAFGATDWTDPTNRQTIQDALTAQEHRSLLRFRGDLDIFLAPYMERDAFISFVGPEKVGKSFWIMDLMWRAFLQHHRVLYYVVGDMSQHQVMRRLICRALGRPLKGGTLDVPRRLVREGQSVRVKTRTRDFEHPVTVRAAVRAMKSVLRKTASPRSRLRLRCCGAGEISASQIEQDVREFTRSGWAPDVIGIDYADLLAPEVGAKAWDFRHQVNETWKILRRIAQIFHLLVVTGTQAAATSYERNLIRRSDFSEDKRKNAHVTGMLGINQTPDEKKQCLYRLNWVFLRDGGWTENQVIHTAGHWQLACPCLVSSL